jgi:hypothetical protein
MLLISALVEPVADLLAPAGDEARAAVVIAQQVVPKRQPVLRVVHVALQQGLDERHVWPVWILLKRRQFLLRRQQADEIEMRPAQETARRIGGLSAGPCSGCDQSDARALRLRQHDLAR